RSESGCRPWSTWIARRPGLREDVASRCSSTVESSPPLNPTSNGRPAVYSSMADGASMIRGPRRSSGGFVRAVAAQALVPAAQQFVDRQLFQHVEFVEQHGLQAPGHLRRVAVGGGGTAPPAPLAHGASSG